MRTVEDLYREDNPGKIISVSGGRKLQGPCPYCEGDDRFCVFTDSNNGEGSYRCGWEKGSGKGCGKAGDIIQYLIDFRGMSYVEACRELGKEPKGGGGEHLKYRMPESRFRKKTRGSFCPEDKNYPEEVLEPAVWREHGMKFVEACHQALLKMPTAISYLASRGITMDGIKKYKLGFHHGEQRGCKGYEPSFRPWPSWGLRDEKKCNGRSRMIMLPAGIVVPYIVDGRLHRITIRLVKPDPKQPKKKYHYVKGSRRDLWLSNPSARAHMIIEAELDCIAVDCAAGDLVGTVGLGSTGMRPDKRSAAALEKDLVILGALDADPPELNPETNKMESAGGVAGVWWERNYPQYKRFPAPVGKDVGEAFEAGVDLREWVKLGLPSVLLGGGVDEDVLVIDEDGEICSGISDQELAKAIADTVTGGGGYHAEVAELIDLLGECDGYVRVHGGGYGLGLDISQDWTAKNREKRARIQELVYSSEGAGGMISNLKDGLYGASDLRLVTGG